MLVKILVAMTMLLGLNSYPLANDCDSTGKVYDLCIDQEVVYETAVNQALKENKIIIVSFGAEWCGWCHKLDNVFKAIQVTGEFDSHLNFIKIGTDAQSGKTVLDYLVEQSGQDVETSYVPMTAVVYPKDNAVAFISTGAFIGKDKTLDELAAMSKINLKKIIDFFKK